MRDRREFFRAGLGNGEGREGNKRLSPFKHKASTYTLRGSSLQNEVIFFLVVMPPKKSTAPTTSQRIMRDPTIQSFPRQGKKTCAKKTKQRAGHALPPVLCAGSQRSPSLPHIMATAPARGKTLSCLTITPVSAVRPTHLERRPDFSILKHNRAKVVAPPQPTLARNLGHSPRECPTAQR